MRAVTVDRDLFTCLLDIAPRSRTRLGHRAQTVGHEAWGICSSWRGCAPSCLEDWQTIHAAIDVLEATMREPVQVSLFESEAAG